MKIFTYIKENSERVNKKNFRNFGNLPMWEYSISKFKDYPVYIDTDSEVVLDECQKYKNVKAYMRDKRFIGMENDPTNKESPALLMTENFIQRFTEPEDTVVVTHVTSPFLKVETLENAISYLNKGYDYVHSVMKIQDFAWNENYEALNFDPRIVQRTQDLNPFYFSLGAFFCFKSKTFIESKNRIGDNTYYYELDKIQSIDIDNEDDMILAQTICKGRNEHN